MKTPMLLAGAFALLLAGGAAAKDNPGLYAHPHGKASTRHVKKVRVPAPPKDPYAAYWKDPSRQAPPFSYYRGDR